MVADCFVSLCKSFSQDLIKELIPVFVKLLCDSVQEVRTSAAGKTSGVAQLISKEETITHLIPCVQKLSVDTAKQVRLAVASDAMMLAPILGLVDTNQHLISILFQLLKDDFPEVRLRLISKLDQLTPVVGLDNLSENVIPAISELGHNNSWRIRLCVIECIPPLASQLSLHYFSKYLCEICFGWLTDSVYAVRTAAITNLKQLTICFGEDFTVSHVLPQIKLLVLNKNYLHRITVLFYIQQVGPIFSQKILNENIIPILLTLGSDPVPNIRYSTSNAIEILLSKMDKNMKDKIRQLVSKLSQDEDSDVRTAAVMASKCL